MLGPLPLWSKHFIWILYFNSLMWRLVHLIFKQNLFSIYVENNFCSSFICLMTLLCIYSHDLLYIQHNRIALICCSLTLYRKRIPKREWMKFRKPEGMITCLISSCGLLTAALRICADGLLLMRQTCSRLASFMLPDPVLI